MGGGQPISNRYSTKGWLQMWFCILGFTEFPVHKGVKFPL